MKITIEIDTPPEFDKYLEGKQDFLAEAAEASVEMRAKNIVEESLKATWSVKSERST